MLSTSTFTPSSVSSSFRVALPVDAEARFIAGVVLLRLRLLRGPAVGYQRARTGVTGLAP
ncbi:MAG: hypothetical protein U0166_03290 [Acidobacteriota bacterium]